MINDNVISVKKISDELNPSDPTSISHTIMQVQIYLCLEYNSELGSKCDSRKYFPNLVFTDGYDARGSQVHNKPVERRIS
jgi:hypothetical protein